MSLTSNNASLEAILATVNALPEAGGGSSGSSLPMCTFTIRSEHPFIQEDYATYKAIMIENGELAIVERQYSEPFSCVQGSLVEVTVSDIINGIGEYSGCKLINEELYTGQFVIPYGSETAEVVYE